MGGRDGDREQARIVALVRDYLVRACADRTRSLSYEAIAKDCGISRGHFSRPEYRDLVTEVLDARAARLTPTAAAPPSPAMPPTSEEDGPDATPATAATAGRAGAAPTDAGALPDADLRARIRWHVDEAHFEMLRWASLRESQGEVDDAPLLLADLDHALRLVRGHAEAMRPLVSELQVRQDAGLREAPAPAPAQTTLALG